MEPLNVQDIKNFLNILESVTFGKIQDKIIYDLYGNPVFTISENEATKRELKFVTENKNPRIKQYIETYNKITGNNNKETK